jgi:4-aminobutyrate aminotransferase-like enzyme
MAAAPTCAARNWQRCVPPRPGGPGGASKLSLTNSQTGSPLFSIAQWNPVVRFSGNWTSNVSPTLKLASWPLASSLNRTISSLYTLPVPASFLRHLHYPTRHTLLSCRTLDLSQLRKDASMTTPAHFVPASQLARSAKSDAVVAKHKKYLWPSVANYFQQPLVAGRGEMQYLWDLDGNKYLDFFGGILTVSVGHCNPKITSKVNAQVNRLQHASTLYPNEHIVALAEKIAQITPGNLQQSFFTNSGTEANEAAILLARMSTGSYDVVALRHAYSGGSQLAKALTAHSPYRKAGVISVGISHAVNAYCYRCPLHLTYPECEVACAGDVENLIQTGTSGNIAAFMAEPIQGVGGFITPPKEYFKIVFKIVKKYGGLFISDEVQTGWGRTGKKWFGIEQWEVVPDMITSAKGMANGVPIGLTVTTPEIAGSFQGMNIATFGGNPVTSVAAKATIELIEEENLLENAHTVGVYFRGKLEELQQKYPLIGDVRGMGLMQALELVKDRKTKEPAPEATTQVMERARQNGLLIGKGGLYGNVLRLAPMLNTTKADVDEAIRLLDKSFSEVRS